ncbi:MAG: glucose 1-dehydrogenase [Candidatus Binatia bacterium]
MGILEGKSAVITGGASGIGAATVKLFVEEGAGVVISDINDAAGRVLADSLGERAVYQPTDVTREQEVKAAVDKAVASFGRLDVMFNNAGAIVGRGSITEIEEKDYDFTMALLLKSVFFGMKHAGAVMARQGAGCILSTSSIAGLSLGGGPHLYSTAKAAVIYLSKSVALELGEKGVRVNCICPGGVATPLVINALGLDEDALPVIEEGLRGRQPIERPGKAEDIAKAALWLASDGADYVTGQAIAVDGGEGLGPKWSMQAMN